MQVTASLKQDLDQSRQHDTCQADPRNAEGTQLIPRPLLQNAIVLLCKHLKKRFMRTFHYLVMALLTPAQPIVRPLAVLLQQALLALLGGRDLSHHLQVWSASQLSQPKTSLRTCCCLKMASCIVALRDENVVISAALQGLVEWNWWAHELLFDLA